MTKMKRDNQPIDYTLEKEFSVYDAAIFLIKI